MRRGGVFRLMYWLPFTNGSHLQICFDHEQASQKQGSFLVPRRSANYPDTSSVDSLSVHLP